MRVVMNALVCIAVLLAAQPLLAAGEQSRVVTATAYTERPKELVNKRSRKTACADNLDNKSKGQTIAVSPDLVKAGLQCGTVVTIEGLSSGFVVNDHLPAKDRNRIDIFVGNDVKMAKEWSHRKVKITWIPDKPVK